jgi:hypothetical protein
LNFYFAINSKDCFFEAEIKHYFMIFARRRAGRPPVSSASKRVSSEEIFKNIVEVEIEWVPARSSAS